MSHAHAPFRLLRTTVIGTTVLGLAAAVHVLAGGSLPGPGIMAALLALHVLCSTIVTTVRIGLPAMVGLLAVSQLVLHQAFDSFSAAIPAATVPPGMHDHLHSAQEQSAAMLHAAGAMGSGMGLMQQATPLSGWMLPAHMTATLATAVLLAQGENALWTLANWLRPLWRGAAVVPPLPAQQASPATAPAPLARLPWRNLRPDTRRGPPYCRAVFA
ncbi:hypothetical protein CVV68_01115 [Arthrobacter livingstonensis]|uniref:Uncharacterized protein n=1 Tax=Arthrobacter livingstonensis TaxID=670078 RepID=A0A2V5LP41_9MICC|nr:hypothetical protein [Arthrobacter livingstonensis]PYI69740.1 hypothetical protein CVV68_01115 [Arthrobacter livingstonensis]